MGSLSVLQGIFPTQELNQGLLHCRWILSYQGSPTDLVTLIRFWVCLTFQVLKSQFIILCRIGVRVLLHPSKREEKSPRLCQAPRPTQLTKLPRFEKLTSTAGSVCSAPCFCLWPWPPHPLSKPLVSALQRGSGSLCHLPYSPGGFMGWTG